MLEHFRDNGRRARGLLNGPSSPQVVAVLANLIEERLASSHLKSRGPVPLDLAAMQTSEAQLGLIRAWLNQGASCSSAAVAAALHRSTTASIRALLHG
jgi:hypothetical protein